MKDRIAIERFRAQMIAQSNTITGYQKLTQLHENYKIIKALKREQIKIKLQQL